MKPATNSFFSVLLSTWLIGCADVADDTALIEAGEPDHSDIVKDDLFAVITLQGAPCTKVIDYEIQDELDYVAVCQTGDRYRIHVSPEGRVNVDTHAAE